MSKTFSEILYEEDGPIGTITLNRPENGNMFTETMCHEIRDCIELIRRETRTRVIVLTSAGASRPPGVFACPSRRIRREYQWF